MIKTRKIKKNDMEALHRIILENWYKDKAERNKELTDAYVQMDLNSCLNKSSFGHVAEIRGEVVGVIMGSIHSQPKQLRVFQTDGLDEMLKLYRANEREKTVIVKEIEETKHAREYLLSKADEKRYEGELVLFAVLPDAQDFGVGAMLFDDMMLHFSNHMIKSFYVLTDTSSDYSFYEHMNLRQVSTLDEEDGFTHMMYDFDFKRD